MPYPSLGSSVSKQERNLRRLKVNEAPVWTPWTGGHWPWKQPLLNFLRFHCCYHQNSMKKIWVNSQSTWENVPGLLTSSTCKQFFAHCPNKL